MPRHNPMQLSCPECGSTHIRTSKIKSFAERLSDWTGRPPMRCTDCSHRWCESLWRLHEAIYSRCPKCFRLELSTWEETYYKIPFSWQLKCALGAKKVRCKACRHNFISFRLVKGKKKWVNVDPTEDTIVETTITLSGVSNGKDT